MTTVSPWRAPATCVLLLFFYEANWPNCPTRGGGEVPAGPYELCRRPLGTLDPAPTYTPCLLGYRFSFEKHFRFYRRTYIYVCECVCLWVCVSVSGCTANMRSCKNILSIEWPPNGSHISFKYSLFHVFTNSPKQYDWW